MQQIKREACYEGKLCYTSDSGPAFLGEPSGDIGTALIIYGLMVLPNSIDFLFSKLQAVTITDGL